ncbi:hypothetical protein DH2020_048839 [Rehmannia glutinosa]|uniref:Small ribosomal subunit protein uS14m n=1 Tax=Rehmannia glutinosa TaxID=99300 RepID=A0ABR0U4I0_REHGL
MRLYHLWSGFLQKDEGKLGKMSEKRNIRDHKCRLLMTKYELRRKLYKAFCKDPDLPSDMRDKHHYKLSKLPRNSSFARVRNRCISTGHPHSVYKFFRISRIIFRGLASQGPLMGIKKSSWYQPPRNGTSISLKNSEMKEQNVRVTVKDKSRKCRRRK